jgi:hypothetical protein
MIFNSFQREDDDSVFTVARNVSGSTVTAGYVVCWDVATSADGVRVSKPATDTLSAVRGLAAETIADSAYGKIQVHGYNSYAYVIPTSTTAAVAGWALAPTAAQWYLTAGVAAGDGKSGFFYHAEAVTTMTTPAATTKKVLIRAL